VPIRTPILFDRDAAESIAKRCQATGFGYRHARASPPLVSRSALQVLFGNRKRSEGVV
jgi:hypothetical protein